MEIKKIYIKNNLIFLAEIDTSPMYENEQFLFGNCLRLTRTRKIDDDSDNIFHLVTQVKIVKKKNVVRYEVPTENEVAFYNFMKEQSDTDIFVNKSTLLKFNLLPLHHIEREIKDDNV